MFLDVPLDVLHHRIFPFLDYKSRTNLNAILPIHERKSTPLRKDSQLEFRIIFTKAMVRKFRTSFILAFSHELLGVLRQFDRTNFICLQYCKNFRKEIIRSLYYLEKKVSRLYGLNTITYTEIRKQLHGLSLCISDTYPFINSYPLLDEFTAVSGNEPPVISVKLPVLEIPYDYTDVDVFHEVDKDLRRGKEMMGLWAWRGDFT